MSTNSSNEMAPAPLPTPPDFPIAWESPSDVSQMWFYNSNNPAFGAQTTPLDFSLRVQALTLGNQAYGLPWVTQERLINSYVYMKYLPDPCPGADELASVMKAAETRVRATIETLDTTWQQTWLPEIQAHLAFWEGYDLARADLPALLAHLAETRVRMARLWEIHSLVMVPTLLALSAFDDLYQAFLPDAPAGEAYQLLVGLDNKTIESGRALWQVSRQATPAVAELLLATAPADAPARLAATEAGRAFWQHVQDYLQTYGKRSEFMYLDRPSWCEEPALVIKYLQNYLRQPDANPEREQQELIAQCEALLSLVRQRLSTSTTEQAAQFESAYKAAKIAVTINEDHNFWIDYQSYYYGRWVARAVGQRLVEKGILDAVDDVFYLMLEELYPLAQAETQAATGRTYRGLVQERRRTAQTFATVTPPPVIGTLAPFPPMTDPISLSNYKYMGTPVQSPPTPGELKGTPASAGKARGKAKVVLTLSDVGKVEPGDVLVAALTSTSWTPLFASVAAVVTEIGGILSHAALVAREYRLPAVVGVQGATTFIADGQLIEVDGAAGIVRLLPTV